jgi:Fe2+-dicitrate sensor, membrane component
MDEKVLLQFLSKKCNSEELLIVDQWITANSENARWLFEMEDMWTLKNEFKYSDEKKIRKAYNRFLKKTDRPRVKKLTRRKHFIYTAAAAAAIFFIVLSIPYFKTDKHSEILNNLNDNINVNEINVPNGQCISIKLADGTIVWLNSGSQLIYPAEFSSKNRIVKLIGEGFFEVEHNKKSPFIVVTGSVKTKVLGTKFNIKAYPKESKRISLLEGGIEVSTENNNEIIQLLEPNQQVEISESGTMKKSRVNSFAISQWTEGEFFFENESLEIITAALKRKFNVTIFIKNDTYKNMVLNSHIKKNSSLEDVLKVFKGTRNIDYLIKGDTVIIY